MAKKQDPELVKLAKQRGFEVHAGMTNGEIRALLGPTPPTEDQRQYAALLAGRPVPLTTFAHAWRVLNDLQELRNTQTLDALGWEVGDVLAWRDGYFQIAKQYGENTCHRFLLQPVDLEPSGGIVVVVPQKTQKAHTHNPYTLRIEEAKRVDLSQWPITLEDHPE